LTQPAKDWLSTNKEQENRLLSLRKLEDEEASIHVAMNMIYVQKKRYSLKLSVVQQGRYENPC
jgi:1,4-alpha-glucan branching enzyme